MKKYLIRLSAALGLFALFACATTTVSQVALDVQLVATGMQSLLTALKQVPGVSADVVAEVQGYVTIIQADAAKVAADTASTSTDTVSEIVATVKSVAAIVVPLAGLPSGVTVIVDAAVSLLPTILQAAGITLAADDAKVPVYSAAQARAILSAK